MVVDILEEEQNGGIEKKERSGEEGRLATLITSTLDTINVDISDFDGNFYIFRLGRTNLIEEWFN